MKTIKILAKLILFVVLLLVPIAARQFWFYRGKYKAPQIAALDQAQIKLPASEYRPFEDQPQPGNGRVVIDLSHYNNLLVDDLTPLRDRLAARGVKIETVDSDSEYTLDFYLRGATALVVMAPTYSYSPEERQMVVDFVNDGGRLLLAADPTRPVPPYEDYGYIDLYSVLFPESAIPAINSLANAFGISYFEDYLYNLKDYAANYRNVKYTTFNDTTPLVEGLSQVIFFAAHSIRSDGISLIDGDANTFSNVRTGETGLTPAVLAADGRILALGDITFLTSPYYQTVDNDHLVSNIADWLAVDSRDWHLEDFPYLFSGTVDLVQTFAGAIDPRLILESSPLQDTFAQAGITLELHPQADPTHDVLYVGTYDKVDMVKDYLIEAGITVTVTAKEDTETATEMTDTTDEAGTDEAGTNEAEAPAAEKPEDMITVEDFGAFAVKGASLFLVDRSQEHLAVIVLAEDEDSIVLALERLLFDDFTGCFHQDDVMVCSTGEVPSEEQPVEEEVTNGETYLDSVLILSVDNGKEGARSSANEFENALSGLYDITTWSTSEKGIPTADDLTGYDVYIVDTGDYAFDAETEQAFNDLNIEGNVLLIGEQPFPFSGTEITTAPINDLKVVDANHPLALGFSEDEAIPLIESESGVPAIVLTKDLFDSSENASVVFARGADSPETDAPAVVAFEDTTGKRYIMATFAFYRLSENEQYLFAWNAVEWLLGNSY